LPEAAGEYAAAAVAAVDGESEPSLRAATCPIPEHLRRVTAYNND